MNLARSFHIDALLEQVSAGLSPGRNLLGTPYFKGSFTNTWDLSGMNDLPEFEKWVFIFPDFGV
jgi:hypothetical protein